MFHCFRNQNWFKIRLERDDWKEDLKEMTNQKREDIVKLIKSIVSKENENFLNVFEKNNSTSESDINSIILQSLTKCKCFSKLRHS